MDLLRRDLLKHAAIGGSGVMLFGTNAMAQDATGEHKAGEHRAGQKPEPKRRDEPKFVTDDKKAVRAATREELLAIIDSEEFEAHALLEALAVRSRIDIVNRDDQTWHVKISKACGQGQDGYWEIGPDGDSESWRRCVYHRVNIVLSGDRVHEADSVEHITAVSTGCNKYEISGGRLVYTGPDSCL